MTEKVLDRKIGQDQSLPRTWLCGVEFAETEPSMNISSQQPKWIRKLPISSAPSFICLVPVSTPVWQSPVRQSTKALPPSKPSSEDRTLPSIQVLEQFVKMGSVTMKPVGAVKACFGVQSRGGATTVLRTG
jgi:hypothetical protein